MVRYEIFYTRQAVKDMEKVKGAGLEKKAKHLLESLRENPYQNPPPYEKLAGDLSGLYSRRINLAHRLVYQIYEDEHKIKIIRMWTHYE